MAIEHANVHEPPPRSHYLRTQGRARQIVHEDEIMQLPSVLGS